MSAATSHTMRAAVADALGGPDVLAVRDEWPAPQPGAGQVALADAETAFPIPAGVDWLVGSALPVIVPTAFALLHPLGRIHAVDRVLVNAAAGGTGMILGQMAKHARQSTGKVVLELDGPH